MTKIDKAHIIKMRTYFMKQNKIPLETYFPVSKYNIMNPLIYGKDQTLGIVSSEVQDGKLINYLSDGTTQTRDFYYYVLLEDMDFTRECGRLAGHNDLQYFVKFETKKEMYNYCRNLDHADKRYWRCYNPVESAMLREGFTYYKGMRVEDVSTLSFDIETTGVTLDKNSYVLLISNTFRSSAGVVTKRLFDFSDYLSPRDLIDDWCAWVREINPDVLIGHNVFNFDFPYLNHVAKLNKTKLALGRNASPITVDRNPRKFRRDGSQQYDYHNVHIFGREIVDTFFLSIKYDVTRKYESYGLKKIIQQEGLEKEGRQHWDFSKSKEPWNNPAEWAKFKQYAKDDADDALALYDLMVPQFFYYAQSIPKPFQEIINTATGSQVNSFMVRSYLQNSEAIPAPSERALYEGAISLGNPGLYKNVYKVDVASLYPSIMLSYNITDPKKDPEGRFIEAVREFTKERLANKHKAAETGERYYKDLSNGQKIMINSFYGFMGATGLNFNYPEGAAEVTRRGRAILAQAIEWAEERKYRLVNADTDSISYEVHDGVDMAWHLDELNHISPDGIVWEDDGVYEELLVVKAKNYALKQGDSVKIKGSALKATMKEPELANFLDLAIKCLLTGEQDFVYNAYINLVQQIRDGIPDISAWSSKKTITKAVLEPTRTYEQRVLDALAGENVQEGDKVRMFFKTPTELCLDKNFDGVYDQDKLYEKLYKTVRVLESVLDMNNFLNYKLKKNKQALENL